MFYIFKRLLELNTFISEDVRMNQKKRPNKLLLQGAIAVMVLIFISLSLLFTQKPHVFASDGSFTLYTTEEHGDLTPLFTHAINSAETEICCFIYSLTDRHIIRALNQRALEGVSILIVYDPTASPKLRQRLHERIATKQHMDQGLMHMKVMTIDDHTAYIGSANFTKGSLTRHGNTVAEIHHPDLVRHIWKKARGFPFLAIGGAVQFMLPDYRITFSFLPDDTEAIERVKGCLKGAKKSIDVGMFTFTRLDLAKELANASNRGVQVSVTLDAGSAVGASKKVAEYLSKRPIDFKKGTGKGLYHHKVARIDTNTLIMGSANWTRAAFGKNRETLMMVERLDPDHTSKGIPRFTQNPVGEGHILTK